MENRNRQEITIQVVSYLGFREFEISLRQKEDKSNTGAVHLGTFQRQDAEKIVKKFFQAFCTMQNIVEVDINSEKYSRLLSLELVWQRAGECF